MPVDKALKVNPRMEKTPRLRKPALAASVAVLLGLLGSNACALSLGRITVQSALGEPLRAEIEIPDINAEEADSLKTGVASAEAFRAAGLEFNPAINNLRVTLQKRPDGRMFLRLSGDRVVNDPFIDLILETNWASGRILRDYTLLFDPPSLRASAAPAPTTAQVTEAAAPSRTTAVPTQREPVRSAEPAKPQRPAPEVAAAKPAQKTAGATQITVRPGDTASKIAGAHKAPNVSLDQMLVALLRENPDAFIASNINRLKAGAVLNVPSAEQAGDISKDEASRTIVAQSKDFGAFRGQLAGAAPAASVAAGDRQSSGKVQTKVEDKKPSTSAPDKLTLSKVTPAGRAAEDKIAAERQAREAAARSAELTRNINELNKLKAGAASVATAPVAASAPTKAASAIDAKPTATAATTTASTPAALAVTTPAPLASAPTAAVASKPAASTPIAPKLAAKAAPSKPAEEPGLLDSLMEDPLVPAGGAVLVAALAGFAVYRSRQRKKTPQSDSSFLDSHLQPDSFFGASGGEQVDTSNEPSATGSSMIYSPSQLDAAGDVDPVAEADVYLAYGRDQQAEDILKDALQVTPSRLAIHSKLAEIYHKRADVSAFNALAGSAYAVSQGQGAEWEHISGLGRELDRDNALYQGGESAGAGLAPAVAVAPLAPAGATPEAKPAANVDLDFDLDFDLGSSQAASDEHPSVMGVLHESDAASDPIALYEAPPEPAAAAAAATPVVASALDQLPSLEVVPEAPVPPTTPPSSAAPAAAAQPEMLSFDLGGLSLDLEAPAAAQADAAPEVDAETDPLATKLALAKEFQSIGDTDGAHALAEEVFSQATGQLRADAKQFLSDLGFAQSGFAQSTF